MIYELTKEDLQIVANEINEGIKFCDQPSISMSSNGINFTSDISKEDSVTYSFCDDEGYSYINFNLKDKYLSFFNLEDIDSIRKIYENYDGVENYIEFKVKNTTIRFDFHNSNDICILEKDRIRRIEEGEEI